MDSEIQEFDQIFRRREQVYRVTFGHLKNLQSLIRELDHAVKNIPNGPECKTISSQISSLMKDIPFQISNDWKDSYAAVAKLTKTIDKKFKSDLSSHINIGHHSFAAPQLNLALASHLYRHGKFDLVDCLIDETGILLDDSMKKAFEELFDVLNSMTDHQLTPAIEWAKRNRTSLSTRESSLEFQLHRLQFLSLCLNGSSSEALKYSKKYFSDFSPKYMKEIQKIMGSLLYINRLHLSPYGHLFKPTLPWESVRGLFIREYSAWMGLPTESPIGLCVQIGSVALPKILKVSSLMKDKGIEWTTQNELPVEINVPDFAKFHSVFSCPVLKEPSSNDNPPMLLPCGHVISKEAVGRLSKGTSSKFKCPYCPGEAMASQAIKMYI